MVSESLFGETANGGKVHKIRITNSIGAYIDLLNYGGTITAIQVPDRNNQLTDVCLGYDTLREYEQNDGYLGAAIGRVANRIKDGRFVLNGSEYSLACNDGSNHLHGGNRGFDKYVWDYEIINENSIVLSRTSAHMEEGYPGNLDVKITYTFDDENGLSIAYKAISDRDTIVNLTNHTYFNMDGESSGSILDTELLINADYLTEIGANLIPTGKLIEVEGTSFDFRKFKSIGSDINSDHPQMVAGKGYDHNFALNHRDINKLAAKLYSKKTGICMSVYTDMPGIQFYSGNMLTKRKGKGTSRYGLRGGLCLETQYFPNAIGCPSFDSPVLRAGKCFESTTRYVFTNENGVKTNGIKL